MVRLESENGTDRRGGDPKVAQPWGVKPCNGGSEQDCIGWAGLGQEDNVAALPHVELVYDIVQSRRKALKPNRLLKQFTYDWWQLLRMDPRLSLDKRREIMGIKIETIDAFIEQLREWYEKDYKGFKTFYDAAVANVQPIPDGQDPNVIYDWKNKGIDDLCQFFNDWYKWLPDIETGLTYIQKFSWLYYNNRYGQCFVTIGPGYTMTKQFVQLRGDYFDSPASRPLVERWTKELGPLMDEFIVPPGGFTSYNDFFIRNVKPDARPIAAPGDDSVVVSPADCVINMIVDKLTEETIILVKTVELNVKQLLNNSHYAAKFIGGTAVSCILMPNMYHRYHAPVSGMVVESNEDVAGDYFGIREFPDFLHEGDVGYGYDYSVFEHFRRGYLIIKTQNYGYVGMIPVGLNTVASVVFVDKLKHITSSDAPAPITKGDEVGWFKYGGSLNILLFEKDRFPALSLLQGQRIGVLNST